MNPNLKSKLVAWPILGFALTLSLPFSSAYAGKDGSGVRGGGQIVDIDSTPYLLDLVTKSTCNQKEGSTVLAENPYLKKVFAKIARLDWYFAFELERETKFLKACFGGPLYAYNPNLHEWIGADGMIMKTPKERRFGEVRQGGFRFYDKYWINAAEFAKMNEHNRAYLILHEVMHSYFRMDTPDRDMKLMSMVKSIERVEYGEIKTRHDLHFQMSEDEVDFPLYVDELDPVRNPVQFLLSDFDRQIDLVKATKRPESLIAMDAQRIPYLASWDQAAITGIDYESTLENALAQAMVAASTDQFRAILGKTYTGLNPIRIALGVYPRLSSAKQKRVKSDPRYRNLFGAEFKKLEKTTLYSKDYRIMAPAALTAVLSNLAPTDAPFGDLSVPTRLPEGLRWLTNAIQALIVAKDFDTLRAQIGSNPDFYRAIGFHAQQEQLRTMKVEIERERGIDSDLLQVLKNRVVDRIISEIKTGSDPADYARFEAMIDREAF